VGVELGVQHVPVRHTRPAPQPGRADDVPTMSDLRVRAGAGRRRPTDPGPVDRLAW